MYVSRALNAKQSLHPCCCRYVGWHLSGLTRTSSQCHDCKETNCNFTNSVKSLPETVSLHTNYKTLLLCRFDVKSLQ